MSKQKTINALESPYANGGIVNLGVFRRVPQKVLTGRPSIDYVTDGGFPIGREILIAGEPSAGKSSLTIQLVDILLKALKKMGDDRKALYVDTEFTLTTDYIESLGADPNNFDHVMPESTEAMFDLIRENVAKYAIIVIDSINNSASEEQLGKGAGDATMANRAKVLTSQLPITLGLCTQHNTTLFILSQIRENMKAVGPYSPKTTIPGGKSLHHNSSMTIELKKSTKKKEGTKDEMELYDTVYGHMVTFLVSKNKVGTPNRTVQVEFKYGSGYTTSADIASAALRMNIVKTAGSWVKYNDGTICQGKDNLGQFLEDNPEFSEELLVKINEKLHGSED